MHLSISPHYCNLLIMGRSKKKKEEPQLHKDLKGFSIDINEFGEIITTYDISKVNEFLNKNVDDKKLRDRDDLEDLKKGKK
jgi:hypothetical protein